MSRYLATSADHVTPVPSASRARVRRDLLWTAVSFVLVGAIATLIASSFVA